MRHQRGFTLIEVLVVVAIIGLLVGITMPSLSGARRQARSTQCKHNLHQMGIALQTYLQTNQDTLPYCARMPYMQDHLATLPEALAVETSKQGELFQCPADSGPMDQTEHPHITKSYFESEKTSYEWNDKVNGQRLVRKNVKMVFESEDEPVQSIEMITPAHDTPLVNDLEGWHAKTPDRPHSTNFLYADMRVDDL